MGSGDDSGTHRRASVVAHLLNIHLELHHLHGCTEAWLPCQRSTPPYPAGACDWVCTIQGEQGLGGSREDGQLVSLPSQNTERISMIWSHRLITLNGMKASEEITEEQSRQVNGVCTVVPHNYSHRNLFIASLRH